MALVDFSPVVRPSLVVSLAARLAHWFAAQRIARVRAEALGDLLSMPAHRLRDLGIDPHPLHQGLGTRHWPTRK